MHTPKHHSILGTKACRHLGLMVLLGWPGISSAAELAPQEKETIATQVRSFALALEYDDVDTPVGLMPPVVVQAMGGYAHVKEATRAAYQKFHQMGLKIEHFEVGDDIELHLGKEHEFIIVPDRMVMVLQGKRVASRGYLLGVRELKAEAAWQFVDGSALNAGVARRLFPDFPDMALPTTEVKVIEDAAPAVLQKLRDEAQDKAIYNQMRMLSLALNQYSLATGAKTATFDDLVGPQKYIPSLAIVDGEDYRKLELRTDAKRWEITTASGRTITLDRNGP